MDMTQEKAHEIAYLGCVSQAIEYCDLKGITDIPIEELLKDDAVEGLAEDFVRILHLKKEEALEFARGVFKDAAKTLAKRKNEAIVRVEDSSHELLGKAKRGKRIILGPEVGIEINREIKKKRVGFTYGK